MSDTKTNGNIIFLGNTIAIKNLKFRYKVIPFDIKDESTGDPIKTHYRTAIYVSRRDKNIEIIHKGFTYYCYSEFRNRESTTQRKRAGYITKFLNYVYFECNSSISDFSDIKLEHGRDFLNNYAISHSKKETSECSKEIKKLYYHFASNKILKYIDTTDLCSDNPFLNDEGTDSNKNNQPLHFIDLSLVFLFFDIAKKVAPDIILGLYLQCFGGLRISEVLHLCWADVEPIGMDADDGFIVNLVKRRMRSDLETYDSNTGVKKARKQIVLPFGNYQSQLYMQHKKNYYSTTDINAVFVNKDGKPMTTENYRRRFNRIKDEFLETLYRLSEEDLDAKLLSKSDVLAREKWSTHIFRGIFSHMIAAHAKNISEIALFRGDTNFTSSLIYLQTSKQTKAKIAANLLNAYKELCGEERYQTLYTLATSLTE